MAEYSSEEELIDDMILADADCNDLLVSWKLGHLSGCLKSNYFTCITM